MMREAAFREQNKKRWQNFEQLLLQPKSADADQLADVFVQLTDDLAYSATQYPESPTTQYLNQLTGKVHQLIYRNKKEKKSRIVTFWTQELPLIFYSMRQYFLYSLILFLVTAAIGAFSAAYDDTFVRLILGDNYVNQTLYNIKNGDPMAVYKQQDQLEMFFFIALNNIKVSFQVFAMGVMLPLIGACVMLFYNGVMLGSFQYFFHTKGLLVFSAMTIWLHGTIEIAAIVLAGGAGWRVGNSILFPETYSRADSFRLGAKEGVKVLFGLIPFFIFAAFIEGFVTRYTEMSTIIKLLIISGSLAFLIWYVILYPRRVAQNA